MVRRLDRLPFDLRSLELFLAVCETGSMGAAARLLGVSQPAVSLATADLERKCGVVLFDRKAHPLAVTASGLLLRKRAEQLLADAQKIPAIMRAIDPSVDLASITNNDSSAYEVCHTFFPCGTKYAVTLDPDPMGQPPSIEAAKAMVAESGYKREKIAIFNPVDMATLAPFGKLTHDLFLKLGLNSELVEMDWSALVQRRTSKEPVEKGGWSVYHTLWFGDSILLPAMNAMIRGQGAQGWFGWYESPQMEALDAEWLKAPTDDERKAIATRMQVLAFQDVPTIPFGSFQIRTAYNKSLAGMIQGPAPLPWGVHRV